MTLHCKVDTATVQKLKIFFTKLYKHMLPAQWTIQLNQATTMPACAVSNCQLEIAWVILCCDSCSASFFWWNQSTPFCTQHLGNLPSPLDTFCQGEPEPLCRVSHQVSHVNLSANRQYGLQQGKDCWTASCPAKFAQKASDSNLEKLLVNYRFCPRLIQQRLKASKTAQQVISFQTALGANVRETVCVCPFDI